MNHFAQRRARVAELLGNGVLILVAPPEAVRSHDTHYPYRSSSDLLWLTGFDEPGCVAVLAPGHADHPFSLFVRPRNRQLEIWDGLRAGPEGAIARYGADAAWPIEELDAILPGLLAGRERVFYTLGADADFDRRMLAFLEGLRPNRRQPNRSPAAIVDPRPMLHAMRRLKDPAELDVMRRSAVIAADAHLRAMRATRPGLHEYAIQAELEHEFVRRGASGPAYTSIVAGGANACILHYTTNRDVLRDGELLLVDAGCELEHYAADITRTWPVGARFSPEQRDVYAAVLDVNERIIELCRPGASKESLQKAAISLLTEHLIAMGLLRGTVEENVESDAYRRFYMHGIGHYLGMDVHDVGDYLLADGSVVAFEPGVVVTVEPGIYIAPDDETVPEAFRGIGVRVEDDVLITEGECEVLTTGVPKSIAAIEGVRAEALG